VLLGLGLVFDWCLIGSCLVFVWLLVGFVWRLFGIAWCCLVSFCFARFCCVFVCCCCLLFAWFVPGVCSALLVVGFGANTGGCERPASEQQIVIGVLKDGTQRRKM